LFKTYSGSGDVEYVELEATGGGTSGGTAELTGIYPVTPPVTTHMARRMIAIGSNYLYYEDI
jgi:hypothetical protein